MLYSNLEVAKAEQLLKSLLSRKPKIEALLNQCIVPTEKEKGNTVCVDDEKIVLPSVAATDSSYVTSYIEILCPTWRPTCIMPCRTNVSICSIL